MLSALVAGAAAGPILLYDALTFTFDPFWSKTYSGQQVITTSAPLELPFDFGVSLLLAPIGLLGLRRARTLGSGQLLLLIWVVMALLWIYAPLPFQYRLAFGLPVGLAIFAAHGWPITVEAARTLGARLRPGSRLLPLVTGRLALYALALLAFSTCSTMLAALTKSAVQDEPISLYAVDRDTYTAGRWLAEHTGVDDVIASSWETGNFIGGQVIGRAIVGNLTATYRGAEKYEMLQAIYQGKTAADAVRMFFRENRVSYVLVGQGERDMGPVDPGQLLGLPLAFETGGARVYRFASS
jgi:hypothetical protein